METATDAATGLLESTHNCVTSENRKNTHGGARAGAGGPKGPRLDVNGFEVAKHRCRSWFCPSCCLLLGLRLRERLLPVLETFTSLQMWTFTVDPTLFGSPREAFEYMQDRRCIGRTIQDLFRWGLLASRRFFCVIEWQKNTEQAHFHVLLDAPKRGIPWSKVLQSWDKHRPSTAGPVVGGRPAFGTVIFSAQKTQFGSALHAARYATKYLTKTPEHGFPAWIRQYGKTRRIRRFSVSHHFWPTEDDDDEPKPSTGEPRERTDVTYAERVSKCGRSVDVYEFREKLDVATGEITTTRAWIGEIAAQSAVVLAGLPDDGTGRRHRRRVLGETLADVVRQIEATTGRAVEWKRGGHSPPRTAEVPERWTCEEETAWRHAHYDVDKEIRRFLESQR